MATACNTVNRRVLRLAKLLLVGLLLGSGLARAEVRFDAFMGFANKARSNEWFPATFEIENDGPKFDGVIEIKPDFSDSQTIRYTVELPTNTRKRLTIPVFNHSGYQWRVRLYNDGELVGEHNNLRLDNVNSYISLLGSVSGQQASGPVFPRTSFKNDHQRKSYAPRVAHLQPDIFPDNPVSLHGMTALYLNSARAINLRAEQADAISVWVRGGGHLILGVDQPSDVTGTPWLAELANAQFGQVQNLTVNESIHNWLSEEGYTLKNDDGVLSAGDIAAAPLRMKGGKPVLQVDGRTVVSHANRGFGQVTVLGFNPEREPVKSWDNRPWLWAGLSGIESAWFASENPPRGYGRQHVDGVYGLMLDSRQISKLPVGWLILLLIAYLVIIGPVDRIWLKRINKQMLTWLTFPTYVILFSLLIYYIGYRLRAGQLEINEAHIVDVLPGKETTLRGRSYASIYSPSNRDYPLGGALAAGAFRPEQAGFSRGGQSSVVIGMSPGKLEVQARVPIWTSRMFSTEWVEGGKATVQAELTRASEGGYQVKFRNGLDKPIVDAALVVDNKMAEAEGIDVAPGADGSIRLVTRTAEYAEGVVNVESGVIKRSIQARNRAFGNTEQGRLEPVLRHFVCGSMPGALELDHMESFSRNVNHFDSSGGIDTSGLIGRGGAVLFLLVNDHAPIPSTGLFETKLGQAWTLYRIPLDVPNTD